jgi:hypothetical protein
MSRTSIAGFLLVAFMSISAAKPPNCLGSIIDFENLPLGQVGQVDGTITNPLFDSFGLDKYVFTYSGLTFSHNGPFVIDNGTWYPTQNDNTHFLTTVYLPMLDSEYKSPLEIDFAPASEVAFDFFAGGNGLAVYSIYALSEDQNVLSEMVFTGDRHMDFNSSSFSSPISTLWIGCTLSTWQASFVIDNIIINRSPDCSAAHASQSTLWPSNNKLVPVHILGVTDPDGDPVTITITAIRQDEPVDALGDGGFTPDGQGIGTATALLRAERSGSGGNGRVYHVYFNASDGRGGESSGEVLVTVPHDPKKAVIDGGPLYDSTGLKP